MLKELRSGLEPAVDSLAAAKVALLVGFDDWLTSDGQQMDSSHQVCACICGISHNGLQLDCAHSIRPVLLCT